MQPASACGKVSKAAAWALWGKALLQQACDEDFIGSKSELLGQAIGKLTAAWDLRKFGELSSVSYSSVWDLSTQKSCAENIFQVNYIQGNADLGSVWNYMYGPEERASPRREKARCRTSRYRLSMIHSSRAMSAALSCGQRTRRGRLTITP